MRADVQGLRAVAVLAVVAFHADRWFGGGFVGVDVFFVISGFVITGSILRRRDGDGRVSIVDFYRRRAVRILPALVLFLIASLPIVLLGPSRAIESAARTAAAATVFLANMQLLVASGDGYFSSSAELNPFLHLWSLSVEEQFYLGFPVLVVVGLWLARRRSPTTIRPLIRLTWLAFASSVLLMLATLALGKDDAAFYLSPVRAWEFLAGALLAMYAPKDRPARSATTLRIAGLGAIAITAVVATPGLWPGPLTAVTVLGTTAVIAAGDGTGRARWLLDNRPMRFLGDISYSWYLWHWPFVVAAASFAPGVTVFDDVAALAALLPAWASFRFVEEPIRHRPLPAVRPLALRSIGAIALAGLIVLVVLPAANDRLPAGPDDVEAVASITSIVVLNSCPSGAPEIGVGQELCGLGGASSDTAVLLGDSFAGQFATPFHLAADTADVTSLVRTRTACPYLPGVTLRGPATRPKACDSHNLALREYLLTSRPALVIISSSVRTAIEDPGFWLEVDDDVVTDVATRTALVLASMRTTVDELARGGTQVVLLRGTPPIAEFSLEACSRVRNMIDPDGCGREGTMAAALDRRAAADAVLDQIAAEFGLSVVDFDRDLCPIRCDAHDDRGWVYVDGSHVTEEFARSVTPLFAGIFDGLVDGPGLETPPEPEQATVADGERDGPPPADGRDSDTDTDTDTEAETDARDPISPPSPDASRDLPEVTIPPVSIPPIAVPPISLPPVDVPATTVSLPLNLAWMADLVR